MKSIKIDLYKISIVLILTGLLIVAIIFAINSLDNSNGRFVLQPKVEDDGSSQRILDSRTGVIYQLKRECRNCSDSYKIESVSEPLPK